MQAAQGSSESAETSALKHFNFGNKLPCYAKIELTLNWLVEKKMFGSSSIVVQK